MPQTDVVALVTPVHDRRRRLRNHLKQLGFEVRELDGFPQASIYSRVVLHLDQSPDPAMRMAMEQFLRGAGHLIVITPALAAMRGLAAPVPDRLRVLIPPVFPWQLRDALLVRPEGM
jgi:hypothetical protein